MLCKKPFALKGAAFGCGQCLPCRLNRRRIWSHRMSLEAAAHAASSFVTLTYDQEHLPADGSVSPDELQRYMKRLRNYADIPIRFFGVGEYGDQTFRPHYHLALFGIGPESTEVIDRAWGFGFSYVGDLTLDSAQYIAGYVTKKMTKVDDERLGGRHPEFARMSLRPGIGAVAVGAIADALQSKWGQAEVNDQGDVPSVLRSSGRVLPLGRYMRGKIRDAIGFEYVESNPDKAFEKTRELYALYEDYKASTESPLGMAAWKEAKKKQKILNMEVKAKIYGQRSKSL